VVARTERHPNDQAPTDVMFGLKRRLEDASDFAGMTSAEAYTDKCFRKIKVTVYVFRTRPKDKSAAVLL
jgi:hypothetical protein